MPRATHAARRHVGHPAKSADAFPGTSPTWSGAGSRRTAFRYAAAATPCRGTGALRSQACPEPRSAARGLPCGTGALRRQRARAGRGQEGPPEAAPCAGPSAYAPPTRSRVGGWPASPVRRPVRLRTRPQVEAPRALSSQRQGPRTAAAAAWPAPRGTAGRHLDSASPQLAAGRSGPHAAPGSIDARACLDTAAQQRKRLPRPASQRQINAP